MRNNVCLSKPRHRADHQRSSLAQLSFRACVGALALYAASSFGSPLQLTPSYPENQGVGSCVASPDSQWVFFTARGT